MRLDIHQVETVRIAAEQGALLGQVRAILLQGRSLTALEQCGVLHALQILIENAIGKAKQLLKASGQVVPISGYDTFNALINCGLIDPDELASWNAVIGLRNRIVYDYMNIDVNQVMALVGESKEDFALHFLLKNIRCELHSPHPRKCP